MSTTRPDPFRKMDPVNLHEAIPLVEDCMRINWTANLLSSPGLGKSAIIKQIAKRRNLKLIDLRLSTMVPEDINGLPDFYDDGSGVRRATYAPMDMWPLEGTPLPINPETGEKYSGWIVFLDEYNSGTLSMQAASYKVVLDNMIGLFKLHSKVRVVTAGNLMTDRAITNELGTATQSRMSHIPIKVCNDTWHFWADAVGIDARVKAFLRLKPSALHNFNPDHQDLTFPCPRTWETTSNFVKGWIDSDGILRPISRSKRPLLSGTISTGMARDFVNFTVVWNELPTLASIKADPLGTPVPDQPSVRHAIVGMIGDGMNSANADDLMKFLLRMSPDFQVICLRHAIAQDLTLLKHAAIGTWMKTNRSKLIRKDVT